MNIVPSGAKAMRWREMAAAARPSAAWRQMTLKPSSRGCALAEDQRGHSRAPRRWCRSARPRRSSDRCAGCRRNRDGRRRRRARPALRPGPPARRRPACLRPVRDIDQPQLARLSRSPAPYWSSARRDPAGKPSPRAHRSVATSRDRERPLDADCACARRRRSAAGGERRAARPTCIKRRVIDTVPFIVTAVYRGPLIRLSHATLQPTLARHRGSAACRSSRQTPRRSRARSVRRQARPCSTGCRACSTMPGSPSATSSLRTTGMTSRTAGHDRNAVYLEAAERLFVEAATRGDRARPG